MIARIALAACSLAALCIVAAGPRQARSAEYSAAQKIWIGGGSAIGETIKQDTRDATILKNELARIRLPEGFRISLFALAPGARHMAVGPETGIIFVGTRRNKVWVIADKDRDGGADEVQRFAPALVLRIPNGPCFSQGGDLFLGELNRVLVFPGAERFRDNPDFAAYAIVAEGSLIPEEDEARGHSTRVCRVGPDGRLYISLGQPHNVSPADKIEHYAHHGIGGIVSMEQDGSGREVFATGLRNSVGMDFNPANGELWFTDNQVDGMGDYIPPGEINRAMAPGQSYGFPWFGGGKTRTEEYSDVAPPPGQVAPAVEMDAHAADLGMMFYTGDMFPQTYRGGIFNAQHGSWDRSRSIGARVMFTAINPDGSAGKTVVFAEGWLDKVSDSYWGRPVDVAELADGSILVSDDHAGAIYRIWYEGP